jgi:maltooligosyltrehalose synthase
MKLFVISRALALRARRPQVFADGAYTPVDAGADAVAFTRGDAGEVLVAVVVRPAGAEASIDVLAGSWRDVLGDGEPRELRGPTPLGELAGSHGLALFERA